ncbi:hypothetical protein Nepgr_005538 [Nepenthes gracilis]|uniref:Avr9/Cf-9 rapidly elicited protein n=1 Tax=Nepenthes gracilis TaxID=150966 RepID=A0AAD3S3U5_NEPGR|nr:hypothetical protein Nepgr_005538 [Nepenthes gracilis]
MESNLPVIAKRLWSVVRVVLIMLRKGICKRRLLLELNTMLKRGKIAGKALGNLMFHHHHHRDGPLPYSAPGEYEFSCSNSPSSHHSHFSPFHVPKRRNHHNQSHMFASQHAPPTNEDYYDNILELIQLYNGGVFEASPSPILPGLGFGKSPMVRQLRITDSPFPLQNPEEDNNHVDQAAEEFIQRFYKQLKQQKKSGA